MTGGRKKAEATKIRDPHPRKFKIDTQQIRGLEKSISGLEENGNFLGIYVTHWNGGDFLIQLINDSTCLEDHPQDMYSKWFTNCPWSSK